MKRNFEDGRRKVYQNVFIILRGWNFSQPPLTHVFFYNSCHTWGCTVRCEQNAHLRLKVPLKLAVIIKVLILFRVVQSISTIGWRGSSVFGALLVPTCCGDEFLISSRKLATTGMTNSKLNPVDKVWTCVDTGQVCERRATDDKLRLCS